MSTNLKRKNLTIGSYSIPWDQPSLLTFLRQSNNAPRFYWESDRNLLSFAGFGILTRLTASGNNRFQKIQEEFDSWMFGWKHFGEVPENIGRLRFFGGFSFFDKKHHNDEWESFPNACFVLPRYILSHVDGESWLTVNALFDNETSHNDKILALKEMVWNIPELSDIDNLRIKKDPPFTLKNRLTYNQWEKMVFGAKEKIRKAELDKVVLSRTKYSTVDRDFSLLKVMENLRSYYPDCYSFLFEISDRNAFFGSTPELLVRVKAGKVQTVALAGSLKRGQTFDEDICLGKQLLGDKKDNQEHNYVVQAIQENLSPYTSKITIPQSPSLMQLNNVQHLVTPIEAWLSDNWGIITLVSALHPTPAVGGLPRKPALALIGAIEPHERGWYAGPIGWFDDKREGVFSVALRASVISGKKISLFAGAGIVAGSHPEKEWYETEWKFRPIAEAIGGNALNGQ